MNGELQYINDTLIIEEYFAPDLIKEAGAMDSVLGSIAGAVKQYVLDAVDTSSPAALGKSVLKLLEPSIFFRIHPLLGTLSVIGQMLGYNVTDILSSLVSSIGPKLVEGIPLPPDQINDTGKILAEASSFDLIVKNAQLAQMGGAFLKPNKGTPLLYRMFGFLDGRNRKKLFTGFIVWFVKTILASAGLLTIGGAAKNLIFKDSPEKRDEKSMPEGAAYEKPSLPAAPVREITTPFSGSGTQWHANDAETAWVVPLFGGIKNTLLDWAVEIYPDFNGYEGIISGLPSFKKIVSLFERDWDSSKPNYLIIPPGFNRRVDIVNTFAGEAENKIKQLKPEV